MKFAIAIRNRRAVVAGTLAASLLLASAARAGKPVLLIHPTMVLLEGRQRSAGVSLVNRGDATGTFLVHWVDYRMTAEGGLLNDEADDTPWSIQPHVRYSPRRVTLEPGATQLIKIALRHRPNVPEGEYFSHLRVSVQPTPSPEDDASDASPARSISVRANTAMAIPVVWRNSKAEPKAEIASAVVDPEANELVVDVRRLGDLSVRGFLHLLTPPGSTVDAALADPLPLGR